MVCIYSLTSPIKEKFRLQKQLWNLKDSIVRQRETVDKFAPLCFQDFAIVTKKVSVTHVFFISTFQTRAIQAKIR